jgi:hypothetical protein
MTGPGLISPLERQAQMDLLKWLLTLLATSSKTTPTGAETDAGNNWDPWG